jgi:hypothetical protein
VRFTNFTAWKSTLAEVALRTAPPQLRPLDEENVGKSWKVIVIFRDHHGFLEEMFAKTAEKISQKKRECERNRKTRRKK